MENRFRGPTEVRYQKGSEVFVWRFWPGQEPDALRSVGQMVAQSKTSLEWSDTVVIGKMIRARLSAP